MSKSQGQDGDLAFWFGYSVLAGSAFGIWHVSFAAGIFALLIAFPVLACVSKVHAWASERSQ